VVRLTLLPQMFAICRLPPDAAVPAWATSGALTSVTRTSAELSIVCAQASVPTGVQAEPHWRCVAVAGPLDFSLTGIMASLAAPLAAAGISLFALSTYDTDYLLIKDDQVARAVAALTRAGHHVHPFVAPDAPAEP
jgi:hypothetical protein